MSNIYSPEQVAAAAIASRIIGGLPESKRRAAVEKLEAVLFGVELVCRIELEKEGDDPA